MAAHTALPNSYSTISFETIAISHVPVSSPTPTKVILLKLNRPDRFNAANEQMIEELVTAFQYFDRDDRIGAIVVTGAGKAFCAGADLQAGFGQLVKNLKTDPSFVENYRDGGGRVTLAIHSCRKPTIMAINGPATGFGITFTLPAAIRVACARAKIGFPFARRGLIMEACSGYFLPRLVGLSKASHLTTTGATYPATDPLLRDLFSEILPTPDETVSRALAIAEDIVSNSSIVSTTVMRDMMWRGPSTPEEMHLLDSKLFLAMLMSTDSQEGIKSFMQKREPDFKGTMSKDAPLGWPWWNNANTGAVGEKASKL